MPDTQTEILRELRAIKNELCAQRTAQYPPCFELHVDRQTDGLLEKIREALKESPLTLYPTEASKDAFTDENAKKHFAIAFCDLSNPEEVDFVVKAYGTYALPDKRESLDWLARYFTVNSHV